MESIFSAQNSTSFQILCCVLERSINIRSPTKLGRRIEGVMFEKSYRDFDGINGEATEFEWNIFPGFTTLQLCCKVNDLLSDSGETPETFTGRILFMSMLNDAIKRMFGKCQSRQSTCKAIWYWTMVIYWSRF